MPKHEINDPSLNDNNKDNNFNISNDSNQDNDNPDLLFNVSLFISFILQTFLNAVS